MTADREPLFRTARMREVYDMDAVDDYIDRVLASLANPTRPGGVTPEQIEDHEFRVVRMREGYLMDDVDGWLDAAAAELRSMRVGQATVGAPLAAEPTSTFSLTAPVSSPPPAPAPSPMATSAPTDDTRDPLTDSAVDLIDPALRALDPAFSAAAAERAAMKAATSTPRSVARISTPAAGLHHVEIWVSDLASAARSFGWLFERTGWTLFQVWENGRSWQAPDGGPYVVIERSPDLDPHDYRRTRPGLNHLAIALPERWMVDRVAGEAATYGWRTLFTDKHPYAGGPHHYAAYLENADGFEVEIVAAG